MPFDLAKIDIRKTVADAGYVTVGIAVLGVQQAQVRRREIQKRLGESGGCLNGRAADGKARLEALQQTVGEKSTGLRGRIETGARSANDWAQELGVTVKDRIEPVVGPYVAQVGDRVKTVINRAA